MSASTSRGTAALVAAAMSDPERACVVGELVWVSDLCDERPCQCEWAFNGVASDGMAMAAEVRLLAGIDRRTVRRTIVERMVPAGYPRPMAAARAEALLDLAAAVPVGTLFRLEHGVPVPFPPGSRVTGPHSIVSPPPEARP